MSERWSPFAGINPEAARARKVNRETTCQDCDRPILVGALAVPSKATRRDWAPTFGSRAEIKWRHLHCPT